MSIEIKWNKNITVDKNFSCEPNPGFGEVQIPVVLWGKVTKDLKSHIEINIGNLKEFPINPFVATLHYGQSIFEGLKAYKVDDNVGIFRLEDAAKRFEKSAQIMSMAPVPPEVFSQSLIEYVKECAQYIPDFDLHSLYLRPILFADDQKIKVASSKSYTFMVMSSIVGDYFATKDSKTKVLVDPKFVRAFKGGTGEAKTAANYALSLPAVNFAQEKGYQQVLYLDAETKTHFEELGGMNFFWVQNGELYTPKLDGSILHGITRKSIIEIAKIMDIKVNETVLTLEDFYAGYQEKSITEVFACGTAATIVPLDIIGINQNDGSIKDFEFEAGPVGEKLKKYLLDTHAGKTKLSEKYLTKVF